MTSSANRRTLVLDVETFSSADLARTGAVKYAEADDFEILLMSYAFDDDPVEVWDFTVCGAPDWLPEVLTDPTITKVAWNMAFERACLRASLGVYTPPEQWRDAMTLAAMNGLPMSLDACGAALRLTNQKLDTGKTLIPYFCKPCKPTKANGGRTRNLPEHAPDKWEQFVEYCRRDTETERTIYRRLRDFPVTAFEHQVESLDARCNERGVLVDMELAEAAVWVDEATRAEHTAELKRLTGLDNPNSVAQLKDWLGANAGLECESLNKATVKELMGQTTDPSTQRVLELRQLLGKTSTKKYQAMLDSACKDNRARGLLQYYGAGRTGRWSGRRLQVQNLSQNHLANIDKVRELVRSRDLETLEMIFDSVPDVLSQLIRTAFIAKPGHTFLVADYSAIEARVIAYLAGEKWRLDTFAQGWDIYCSSASQMFKVPVVKHGVNGHLRQKGKIAELACGYGGGVGALKAFGADKMGLTEEEMQTIVNQWRAASPTIPKFWRDTEKAAKRALQLPGLTYTLPCGVAYWRDADALRCKLPSGRILSYWAAHLDNDGSICFMGQNQTTRKWEKTQTWGGKLVENIVQAYARDCLATAMVRLAEAGYRICFSVHDELIVEEPINGRSWEDMAEIMGQPIPWAPGLLLTADGYSTRFYKKD